MPEHSSRSSASGNANNQSTEAETLTPAPGPQPIDAVTLAPVGGAASPHGASSDLAPTKPAGPEDASAPEVIFDRDRIPGHVLLEVLGRGGMGVVYKAQQTMLRRIVAVKMILHADYATAEQRRRFLAEAEAVAQLAHPNIVQIYEVGEQTGVPYFSLELCGGGRLEKQIQGTPWEAKRAAAMIEVLARAIECGHRAGLVHRDLKPGNILLTEDGTPKITDFGLAKRLNVPGQTHSNAVIGTPSYMPPEQTGGQAHTVGPAADIYGLGAILYELLTGHPPFKAATAVDTILQVVSEDPVPVRRLQPKVPRDLETICHKCLQKDTRRRYASAQALAEDLQRFLRGEPVTARPIGALGRWLRWARRRPAEAALVVLSGLLLLLALVALSWQWSRAEDRARQETGARKVADEARAEARRRLHDAHMSLAWQAWQAHDVAGVGELLSAHAPGPGEEDLRGWEWFRLWHLCRGDRLTVGGRHAWARTLAYSPDGNVLATGGQHNSVRLWDTATGRQEQVFSGHTATVRRVTFHPNGKFLVSTGDDQTVRLWDLQQHKGEVLYKHDARTWAVALAPDGTLLASGDLTGHVVLFEWVARRERHTFGPIDPVNCAIFSPDSKRLALGCQGGAIYLWEVSGRVPPRRYQVAAKDDEVLSVAFAPDGKSLALGLRNDPAISLWDLTEGRTLARLEGHKASTWGLAFSPDGERLASASWDRTAKVWDVARCRQVHTLRGHLFPVKAVAFSPTDRSELATASVDGTSKLWHIPVDDGLLPLRAAAPLFLAAASADGTTVLTVGGRKGAGKAQNWDVTRGQERLLAPPLRQALASATALAVSPEGNYVALGDETGGLSVCEVATGNQVHARLACHDGRIDAIAFAPDGKWLATGNSTKDRCLHFWSFEGGVLAPSPRAWEGPIDLRAEVDRGNSEFQTGVSALAFTADGTRLAIGGTDRAGDFPLGLVQVVDVATGQAIAERLTGHSLGTRGVAFAPDGRTVATTDWEGTIKLWSPATSQEKGSLGASSSRVVHLMFVPGPSALLSVCEDGSVFIQKAATPLDVLHYAERRAAADSSDVEAQIDLVRACWGAGRAGGDAARYLERGRSILHRLQEESRLPVRQAGWPQELERVLRQE
jgi:WD40 repeat protein/tRNA A-37 threonylcarbamoyl transferase component Bud32